MCTVYIKSQFLSPPVQIARWALMRHFLSVCLSVCLSVQVGYSLYLLGQWS